METLEAIMSRKSIRSYTDEKISDEKLRLILKAGMSGPSCVNARDWIFIVVRDKEMLNKMADANGRPAEHLRKADVGILICGDLVRAFSPAPDYWIIDGSIAIQNMTLAAHSLGIGSVWLGTYPQMDRVKNQVELFGLPDTVIPHSLLALGYPDETSREEISKFPKRDKPEYEEDRVHFENW